MKKKIILGWGSSQIGREDSIFFNNIVVAVLFHVLFIVRMSYVSRDVCNPNFSVLSLLEKVYITKFNHACHKQLISSLLCVWSSSFLF
jgi:hypothetical protein